MRQNKMIFIFGVFVFNLILFFNEIDKALAMQRVNTKLSDKGKGVNTTPLSKEEEKRLITLGTSRRLVGSAPTYEYDAGTTAQKALDLGKTGLYNWHHHPDDVPNELVIDESMRAKGGKPAQRRLKQPRSNLVELDKPKRPRGPNKEKKELPLRKFTSEEARKQLRDQLQNMEGFPTTISKKGDDYDSQVQFQSQPKSLQQFKYQGQIQGGPFHDNQLTDFNSHNPHDLEAQYQAQLYLLQQSEHKAQRQLLQQSQHHVSLQRGPSRDNRLLDFDSPNPYDSKAQYQAQIELLQQAEHQAQRQSHQHFQHHAALQGGPFDNNQILDFNSSNFHSLGAQYKAQLKLLQQAEHQAQLQLRQQSEHQAQLQLLQQFQHHDQLHSQLPYIHQSLAEPQHPYIYQSQPQSQTQRSYIHQSQPQTQPQAQLPYIDQSQPQENNLEDDVVFIPNSASGYNNPHLEAHLNNPAGHSFSHHELGHTRTSPYYSSSHSRDPGFGSQN